MSGLKIEFTDKEITPWGGISILQKMMDKMSFSTVLKNTSLPVQGSNRGYDPVQLIVQFIVSIWCGASRYQHLEVTRFDGVIQQMFGWKRMAANRAFIRYFQKFSMEDNTRVFTHLYQWFFNHLAFDNFTLDLDSSVVTRYGEQQGAAVGYNPKKPGRKSHHPLMAFVADVEMVANFWLRSETPILPTTLKPFYNRPYRTFKTKQQVYLLDITHHSLPLISEHSLPLISVQSLPVGSSLDD